MALIPAKEVRPPLPRGPFLVVGLARSGQAAARLLAARGERVRAVDSGRPEGAERLSEEGVEVFLDTDGLAQLEGVHTVVKSPGVPREAAVIATAAARGIEVTGELELAWRALPNRFLAITGTNGKTTTVELLGHIFRGAGEPVAVAGNVGVPVAGLVGELEPDATVVCEASSFQLEDASLFSPEGAVFLNLAPDHLDRHGDLPAYRDAKLRIFANQGNDDVAVWNGDDPELAGVDLGGCARRVEFCRGASPDCEVAAAAGTIFWDGEPLLETAELGIPGEHNVENAMAAAAAALSLGIDRDAVRAGLRSFAGVPHRLEPVAAKLGGVRFVNDSKATNVASAVVGIGSFDRGVHAILGGSEKDEPFGPLVAPLRERAAAVYLLGDTAARMETELAPLIAAGVPLHRVADLEAAVRTAAAAAMPGEVVLLSPACASFDAFANFEARGERFRQIVAGLR
ncbi:MAG TPA: UDP-N-acetylmuramoyl-L-alanine--D-glutamate ligase [Solirubrobacterales bacterium]|nr:UDP-N-acetylmuramoyl-L-alanine--D-glutamate ligase [Solirubrobacterales bacterium]